MDTTAITVAAIAGPITAITAGVVARVSTTRHRARLDLSARQLHESKATRAALEEWLPDVAAVSRALGAHLAEHNEREQRADNDREQRANSKRERRADSDREQRARK